MLVSMHDAAWSRACSRIARTVFGTLLQRARTRALPCTVIGTFLQRACDHALLSTCLGAHQSLPVGGLVHPLGSAPALRVGEAVDLGAAAAAPLDGVLRALRSLTRRAR
mgnify:CR=1 FL=1